MSEESEGVARPQEAAELGQIPGVCPAEEGASTAEGTKASKKPSPLQVTALVGFSVFVDALAYSLVVAFLPSLGHSSHVSGACYAAFSAGALAMLLPVGYLVDRGWGLAVMLSSAGLGCIASLCIAFFDSEVVLVAARAMQGMASSANWTAALALLQGSHSTEELGSAAGSAFFCGSLGTMLGPLLGSALYEAGNKIAPMGLLATLYVLDGGLRVGLIGQAIAQPAQQSVAKDAASLCRNYKLWPALSIILLLSAALHYLNSILPAHLAAAGHSSLWIGLLFVIQAVCYGVACQLAGLSCISSKVPPENTLVVGCFLVVAAFVLLATWGCGPDLLPSALSLALLGSSLGVAMLPLIPLLTRSMKEAGSECWGLIFALFNMFFTIGALIGPAVASALVDAEGYCFAFSACAVFFAFTLFIFITVLCHISFK